MANRLSEAKRGELWTAYQTRQSIDHVAKKCGVHHRTVERYRLLDSWDERLSEIQATARKRADYTLAESMAESLAIVRDYKARLALALSTKRVSSDDVTATELEKVIKLETFVLGGVESRHQLVTTEFGKWTEEELEEFARDGTVPGSARGGAT